MMQFTLPHRILPFAVAVYRLLLWVYPADHRCEYGPMMVQLFRDRCRDMCQKKGTWTLLRFWSRVLQDTLSSAVLEHFDELKERSQQMTRKQRFLIGACILGPLVLWGCLFAVNHKFMGRVFVHPLGWVIVSATILFLGLAYLLQRWAFRPVASDESAHLVMDKLSLSILVFLGSLVFLVLPAVLLIGMGPAVITMVTRLGQ